MHLDWWTIALQTINFAILVWLLHRFLYKPVLAVIEMRKAEVQQQYDEARAAENKAKAHLAELEAERARIGVERETVLSATAAAAEETAQARRVRAETEAREFLDRTRTALAAEREGALEEARSLAIDLGADFARRILAEAPVECRAEAWIEPIEHSLKMLSKPELEALRGQLKGSGGLTVVTAAPLAPAATDVWRNRLRRSLGNAASIAFEVNPDLIGGAELHFPAAVIKFSWRNALACLRSEIDLHGNAPERSS
jgi:F-type H+-transporting ATPase subunit b